MDRYHRTTLAATLGAATLASLAIVSPGAAWDELPCGPTEETAHLCALGEVARDGTIPNPLPTPAPVPVVPEIVPSSGASAIATPAVPDASPALPVRYTCAQLVARHAGPRSLRDRGCVKTPRATPLRTVKVGHPSCSSRWLARPRVVDTVRGADGWWHPLYAHGVTCGRGEAPVAGSLD